MLKAVIVGLSLCAAVGFLLALLGSVFLSDAAASPPLTPEAKEPSTDVPRVIWAFWFGNAMRGSRRRAFDLLVARAGVPVKLITAANLSTYAVPSAPLHEAFDSLSALHKSDYLTAYFAHHHGGGVADIKVPTGPWGAHFGAGDTLGGGLGTYLVGTQLLVSAGQRRNHTPCCLDAETTAAVRSSPQSMPTHAPRAPRVPFRAGGTSRAASRPCSPIPGECRPETASHTPHATLPIDADTTIGSTLQSPQSMPTHAPRAPRAPFRARRRVRACRCVAYRTASNDTNATLAAVADEARPRATHTHQLIA